MPLERAHSSHCISVAQGEHEPMIAMATDAQIAKWWGDWRGHGGGVVEWKVVSAAWLQTQWSWLFHQAWHFEHFFFPPLSSLCFMLAADMLSLQWIRWETLACRIYANELMILTHWQYQPYSKVLTQQSLVLYLIFFFNGERFVRKKRIYFLSILMFYNIRSYLVPVLGASDS